MKTITVQLLGGEGRSFEIPVKRTVGPFAIHRPLAAGAPAYLLDKEWSLTHIPTGKGVNQPGCKVSWFRSLRLAVSVAGELSRVPGISRVLPSATCGRRAREILRRHE